MDFFKVIAKRHSWREPFENEPIPREDLIKIVQTGIQAPSGRDAQTVEFVIVDDADILQNIATIPNVHPQVKQAKALIACIVNAPYDPIIDSLLYEIEDCAAAVENMWLAITAMGYATVWTEGWLRAKGRAEKIRKILGVPDGKSIRIVLPVGVPGKAHTPRKSRPLKQRTWFNHYGQKD